jgi:hypothetical protein
MATTDLKVVILQSAKDQSTLLIRWEEDGLLEIINREAYPHQVSWQLLTSTMQELLDPQNLLHNTWHSNGRAWCLGAPKKVPMIQYTPVDSSETEVLSQADELVFLDKPALCQLTLAVRPLPTIRELKTSLVDAVDSLDASIAINSSDIGARVREVFARLGRFGAVFNKNKLLLGSTGHLPKQRSRAVFARLSKGHVLKN